MILSSTENGYSGKEATNIEKSLSKFYFHLYKLIQEYSTSYFCSRSEE